MSPRKAEMPVKYSIGLDNIFAVALIVLFVFTNIFQLWEITGG
jgi:hypothetical protein